MADWKERLDELGELISRRSSVEDEAELREITSDIERVSDELKRVWQMTDEQIGIELRNRLSEP